MKTQTKIILISAIMALTVQPIQAQTATQEERIVAVMGEVLAPQAEISAPEAEEVLEVSPKTVQQVLTEVCESRGYGEACAKHLLGMLWKESNNKATAVGDRGKAQGYFQIWHKLHKVTLECTQDLVCSANWTLDYLERNSYPRYVNYAIQCHNGCNINNGYAASALRHGTRLWNQPLTVKTAEEYKLALNK